MNNLSMVVCVFPWLINYPKMRISDLLLSYCPNVLHQVLDKPRVGPASRTACSCYVFPFSYDLISLDMSLFTLQSSMSAKSLSFWKFTVDIFLSNTFFDPSFQWSIPLSPRTNFSGYAFAAFFFV